MDWVSSHPPYEFEMLTLKLVTKDKMFCSDSMHTLLVLKVLENGYIAISLDSALASCGIGYTHTPSLYLNGHGCVTDPTQSPPLQNFWISHCVPLQVSLIFFMT